MINKNIYLIADTHFGHFNVKKFEPIRLEYSQKFNFNDDVDSFLEARWNNIIKENDIVFHLGDLYFEGKFSNFSFDRLNKLNGNKILLIGNHDRPKYYNKLDDKWEIIDKIKIDLKDINEAEIIKELDSEFKLNQKEKRLQVCYIKEIENVKIMFTHFPLYNNSEYDNKYKNIVKSLEYLYEKFNCQLNIHGHTHSNGSSFKDSVSVCVEKIEFNPIKLENILIKKLTFDLKLKFEIPFMKAKMIAKKHLNMKEAIDYIKNTKNGYFEFGMLDYKESKVLKELRESNKGE